VYQYCSSSPATRVDHAGTQDETAPAGSSDTTVATAATNLLHGVADAVASLRRYTTSRALKINIDEIKAISQRGSWWNPKNKQFLDWMSNQATKPRFKWTHVMPSRKQISLASELAKGEEAFLEAAKSLMVRRFSEVKELKAITMAAKDAMRNLSRPRRELASAINQAIRGRIARAATEEARLVARALRTVGVDPQTLTFVKQEVAAVAGAASAAGKTEQAVGAL